MVLLSTALRTAGHGAALDRQRLHRRGLHAASTGPYNPHGKAGRNVVLYELPVFSEAMGLSGLCDCVEANRVPEGTAVLPGFDGVLIL